MGYQAGVKETEKAFGGCKTCYGKGYSTSLEINGLSDGDIFTPIIYFCGCSRGKQLEIFWKNHEDIVIKKVMAHVKKKK